MNSKTRNIVIAGVSGLAVGAVLGVLFAPAEGKETRAKLKAKKNELVDKVSDKLENPHEMLAKIKEKVETSMKNGKASVKEELLKKIETLEEAIRNA